MGKNSHQPLFRITASTISSVEMQVLVKREYKMWRLSHMVWAWMYDLGFIPEEGCGIDLACDGERVNLSLLLKDHSIREDLDPYS